MLKGVIEWEFEHQCFKPHSTDKKYWIVYGKEVFEQFNKVNGYEYGVYGLPFNSTDPTYIEARGLLSPHEYGSCGHMNRYDKYFKIDKIMEIKVVKETELIKLQQAQE